MKRGFVNVSMEGFKINIVGVEPPGTEAQTRMTSEMGVGSQIRDTQR